MVKSLQSIPVSLSLGAISLAVFEVFVVLQPARSIGGLILALLFPIVALGSGWLFVTAFSRLFTFPRHPIARFILPVLAALFLLVFSMWLGAQIGVLIHRGA
jgi:ATP/ADP translocase